MYITMFFVRLVFVAASEMRIRAAWFITCIIMYACRVVKASSPWLNAVLLVGIIIWLPSAMFNSLAVSSIEYDGIDEEHSNALCHVS